MRHVMQESKTTLRERQEKFDAEEFSMFNRVTGQRYCDTMTREQFEQMKKNMEKEHDNSNHAIPVHAQDCFDW